MVDADYFRRKAAERRRRRKIEKGLDPKVDYRRRPPSAIPDKPTKQLRQRDFKAYMAAYMRWHRWFTERRP